MRTGKYKILVAAAAVIVWVLFYHFFAPGVVRNVARGAASRSLGQEVSIRRVSFSLVRGVAEARGIAVANKDGFYAENIIRADKVRVSFAPMSFFGDTVELREIVVEGVDVFVEQEGRRNNLVEFLSGMPGEAGPRDSSGKDVSAGAVKIEAIEIHVRAPGHTGSLRLDPIILKDLHTARGAGIGGVSARAARALAGEVLRQIAGGVGPEVEAGEAFRSIRDESMDALEGAVEGIRRILP